MQGSKLHPLAVVLLAAVGAACLASHPRPQCRAERGCPASAPLAPCPADLAAPRPLGDVVAHADTLVGQRVAVRAPLIAAAGGCTELACRDHSCCNRCTQMLLLSTAPAATAHVWEQRRGALVITPTGAARGPNGQRYVCEGDESRVCCDVDAHGQDVVAQGRVVVDGTGVGGRSYRLEDVSLCAPAAAP